MVAAPGLVATPASPALVAGASEAGTSSLHAATIEHVAPTRPRPAYEGRATCGATYPQRIVSSPLDGLVSALSGNTGIKAVDNPVLSEDYKLLNQKTVAENRKHNVATCELFLGQKWKDGKSFQKLEVRSGLTFERDICICMGRKKDGRSFQKSGAIVM